MDKSMPARNLRGMLATAAGAATETETAVAAAAVDILPYRQPASVGPQCEALRLILRYTSKTYGVYGNLEINLCGRKASLCQYVKPDKTAGSTSPPHDSATGQRQRFKANKNPAAQGCRV
jgi:hypothetical protein